jgi:hypothetical protein
VRRASSASRRDVRGDRCGELHHHRQAQRRHRRGLGILPSRRVRTCLRLPRASPMSTSPRRAGTSDA